MKGLRIDRERAVRMAALGALIILGASLLPGLLRTPEPPPIPADIGFRPGELARYRRQEARPGNSRHEPIRKHRARARTKAKARRAARHPPEPEPDPTIPRPAVALVPPDSHPAPAASVPSAPVPAPVTAAPPTIPSPPPPPPGDGSQEFAPR